MWNTETWSEAEKKCWMQSGLFLKRAIALAFFIPLFFLSHFVSLSKTKGGKKLVFNSLNRSRNCFRTVSSTAGGKKKCELYSVFQSVVFFQRQYFPRNFIQLKSNHKDFIQNPFCLPISFLTQTLSDGRLSLWLRCFGIEYYIYINVCVLCSVRHVCVRACITT